MKMHFKDRQSLDAIMFACTLIFRLLDVDVKHVGYNEEIIKDRLFMQSCTKEII